MARFGGTAMAGAMIGIVLAGLLSGGGPARAAGCDEDNPLSPKRSTRITLTAADATDESARELRSFVETGSLGKVDISLVRSRRGGSTEHIFATPHLSRVARDYGEALKGIEISAALSRPARGTSITVEVRQVCAQYFRNSFLYK